MAKCAICEKGSSLWKQMSATLIENTPKNVEIQIVKYCSRENRKRKLQRRCMFVLLV